MDVSLGGTLSGENASIVAAARDDGILLLSPSASADTAIQGNDSAFRVCFQDSAQGTRLDLRHDAATPVGMEVTAEATLTAVDGRRLTFTIEAADEKGPIGSCAHERVLVTAERFLEKAYQQL